ncbi:hypothetical protein KBY57_10430 [Cyanobium sp. Aljojuca 7D2]|uniref:hypothetical protein n=1 Tax=Cyanobium sp. Aljojuca 7D2 TaxID=2823698 RepID=UPI0020CE4A43|nr:hypothetical protein [Cyanobium sp. Aljojuca 7D2]MCP9891469.1 hypothetical protein [Cyanobium sp. Aljojuca 7D2]
MATTAAHNSPRTTDESSELLEQHLPELGEPESNSTADYPPADRQVGIALADAEEPSTSEIQPSSGLGDALKAERRRSNNLEKELRGLRQQLTRFSEINPEEYARLQQAERQKQLLEQQVELRERQMEEASARKVAAVAAERDAAHERVQELRKERLLERAFSEAEGRTGGDGRGTFFQVFKGQLGESFRLTTSKDGIDVLEPLDSQGQPLLGDDGRPLSTADFLDQLRIHPVYGFLFQQRGAMTGSPGLGAAPAAAGAFGEVLNPQAMSASELYRAGFVTNGRSPRR